MQARSQEQHLPLALEVQFLTRDELGTGRHRLSRNAQVQAATVQLLLQLEPLRQARLQAHGILRQVLQRLLRLVRLPTAKLRHPRQLMPTGFQEHNQLARLQQRQQQALQQGLQLRVNPPAARKRTADQVDLLALVPQRHHPKLQQQQARMQLQCQGAWA